MFCSKRGVKQIIYVQIIPWPLGKEFFSKNGFFQGNSAESPNFNFSKSSWNPSFIRTRIASETKIGTKRRKTKTRRCRASPRWSVVRFRKGKDQTKQKGPNLPISKKKEASVSRWYGFYLYGFYHFFDFHPNPSCFCQRVTLSSFLLGFLGFSAYFQGPLLVILPWV